MTLAAGQDLLDLAAELGVPILEDSPCCLVSPGERLPTRKALGGRRGVVHLGSFSKTLFPGARVGFAVADQEVTDAAGRSGLLAAELTKIKSMVRREPFAAEPGSGRRDAGRDRRGARAPCAVPRPRRPLERPEPS